MRVSKQKEQQIDVSFFDLPEKLQKDLMEIHNLIRNTCYEKITDHVYDDIEHVGWAKSMLEEFVSAPYKNGPIGTVRVYKNGRKFSCMIQITAHVQNDRRDIDHELFHDFIRNVHQCIKTKVRRKYNMSLVCESEHGETFEAFDVWTSAKVAKELWEMFQAKGEKITTPKAEIHESADNSEYFKDKSLKGVPNRKQIRKNKREGIMEAVDAAVIFGSELPEEIQSRLQTLLNSVANTYAGFASRDQQLSSVITIDQSLTNCRVQIDGDHGVITLLQPTQGSQMIVSGVDEVGMGTLNSWINRTMRTCKLMTNDIGQLSLIPIQGGVSGIALELNPDVVSQIQSELGSDEVMESRVFVYEYEDLPPFLTQLLEKHCNTFDEDTGMTEFTVDPDGHISGRMVLSEDAHDLYQTDPTKNFIMEDHTWVMEFMDTYAEHLFEKMDDSFDLITEYVDEVLTEADDVMSIIEQEESIFDTEVEYLGEGYFLETSKRNLKYAFRRAYDLDTGHLLKIVYDLQVSDTDSQDAMQLVYPGHAYKRDFNKPSLDYKDYNDYGHELLAKHQKEIPKKGNVDMKSSGHRVLAIIDLTNGERISDRWVNVIGEFNANVGDTHPLKMSPSQLHTAIYNSQYGYGASRMRLKEGAIDRSATFKSTKWFSDRKMVDSVALKNSKNNIRDAINETHGVASTARIKELFQQGQITMPDWLKPNQKASVEKFEDLIHEIMDDKKYGDKNEYGWSKDDVSYIFDTILPKMVWRQYRIGQVRNAIAQHKQQFPDRKHGDGKVEVDNGNVRNMTIESLTHIRGAKANDINWNRTYRRDGKAYVVYYHPSHKDISRHPWLYQKEYGGFYDPKTHEYYPTPEEKKRGYQGPDAEKKQKKETKKMDHKNSLGEAIESSMDPAYSELFENGVVYENNPEYIDMILESYGVFLEKSHGKVLYAFRMVTDAKTKHSLKVVYPLDGQVIDLTNKEGKSYKNHASYKAMKNCSTNEERLAFIRKNGCLDFASHNAKVVAIVDTTNNQNMQQAYCVGAYNMKGLDMMDDEALAKEAQKPDPEVYFIKVGQVEQASTFKSTFWPKNSKWWQAHMAKINAIEDPEERMKENRYDVSVREVLGVGKGAKLNDLTYQYRGKKNKKNEAKLFRHPKKYKTAEEINTESVFDPYMDRIMEATSDKKEAPMTGDMSPVEAKRTLASISRQIIEDPNKKVTQYTGNIYANIISKNLLRAWGSSYRKLKITVDDYQSFNYVEFKIPKMTLDFVSRYVEGRETLEGFLHRSPEIRMKVSPRIFHTMKDPNDAYAFFLAAVRYYEKGAEKFSRQIISEIMKSPRELKHLMSTTKLSGLLTVPMSMLFQFDNVDLSKRETFKIKKDDVDAVRSFIRNIYTKYASPADEKQQILKDMTELVKSFQETVAYDPEAVREWDHFIEYVTDLYQDHYHDEIICLREAWQEEQIDVDWVKENRAKNGMFMEKLFVKRLKKIPRDLVAYVTIEGESIKDANDKLMIASYCLSKVEIVEWYIELIDAGDSRYIVPHDKKYLESLRTQLLAAYQKIMATPIPEKKDPFTIDIRYPGKS